MAPGGIFAGIPWRSIVADASSRVLFLVKTGCIAHVFNSYICGIALLRGPSMLPTLNLTGDVVAVERVSMRLSSIGVGDVVLLRSPESPRKVVTKRVMGMEGDTVTFMADPGRGDRMRTVVVPKGHVWVQGDNIYDSRDSRQFGPVSYGLIQGRAFARIWPLEKFGFIGQKL